MIINGDCLDIIPTLEPVDLIYIDPPFGGNSCDKQFGLHWKSLDDYLDWLKPRVQQCHDVLKKTGSLYLHCDYHANAYIRVEILDKIFGYNNFRNEIIWLRKTGSASMNNIANAHDTIFYYTKSKEYIFNQQYTSYNDNYIKTTYNKKDKRGLFRLHDVVASPSLGGISPRYTYKGYTPETRWLISKDKLKNLDSQGLITWSSSGRPYRKLYLTDMPGKSLQDTWIDVFNTQGKERLGYPTQKPEKLLERIIKASSNKGDIVLDPFCGCGTACVVAQRLGRKYIGIDINEEAIRITKERLKNESRNKNR